MHEIDSASATDDNHFTEGDPTIPVPATVVTADWLNAVQGEIVKVIEDAGITLNKESNTQLKDALEIMLAEWTPDATATVKGILKLATEALALAGADDSTAMTPLKTKKLIDASSMEAYRLSRIGTPMPVASTVLDDSYKIADGSLVLFADYPELEAKYNAGGLMVLDAESTADEQTAKPLYFVAHSEGTGLYLPRLGGLFARTWTCEDDGTAGGYNEAGLPNIEGAKDFHSGAVQQQGSGALSWGTSTNLRADSVTIYPTNNALTVTLNAAWANGIYGNSDTVMPESYNQPLAIYLGQPIATE